MKASCWRIFIQERFPILKHVLLIAFFFGANVFVALDSAHLPYEIGVKGILGFLVVLLAFLRLRIFDEIKDYENDLLVHPDRPLARGLISIHEAKKAAFLLIAAELALSFLLGLPAFLTACCVVLYSLLMYKEFYLRNYLRSRLATYALTHTVVSAWLSLFLFSAATGQNFWQAPPSFLIFITANWMIFNVFEFGRKTFGKEEEKVLVESYSKNFGPKRAAFCVLGMAACAGLAAWILGNLLNWPPLLPVLTLVLFALLFIASLFYGHSNSAKWAKRFRHACSAFILLYNMIITLGFAL